MTELLRDAWLLVQMLLLTATLYQALESWIEVSEALLSRDVAGARAAAAKRFIQLSKDVWWLICVLPATWHLWKFSLATLVFGLLVPVDLIARLPRRLRACRGLEKGGAAAMPSRRALAGGALVWGALLALPFLLVYVVAPAVTGDDGELLPGYPLLPSLLSGYIAALLLLGVLSTAAAVRREEAREHPSRYPTPQPEPTSAPCSPRILLAPLRRFSSSTCATSCRRRAPT